MPALLLNDYDKIGRLSIYFNRSGFETFLKQTTKARNTESTKILDFWCFGDFVVNEAF